MEEKENKQETLHDKINNEVEKKIESILTQGIKPENIENLYKLVDIHKDIANEQYWLKEGGQDMRYRYGNDYMREETYNGGRRRDSRGRYMERGRENYRGDEPMEEMYEKYQEYSEGREQYGHDDRGTMKALEYMLEAGIDFFEMLFEDAKTPEAKQMIKHYAKKISEMM